MLCWERAVLKACKITILLQIGYSNALNGNTSVAQHLTFCVHCGMQQVSMTNEYQVLSLGSLVLVLHWCNSIRTHHPEVTAIMV